MRWLAIPLGCGALGLLAGPSASLAAGDDPPIDFDRDVRPILAGHCFPCHGPDAAARQADLRLDMREGATAPRKAGRAVEPDEPAASLLLERIRSADPARVMPPPDAGLPLDDGQRARLERWITAGAPYAEHWAFVPPRQVALSGSAHPIDELVARGIARAGLVPAPEAEPATLLRRVTLDLTGLPPTPEELAAFLADPSRAAWEQVVERLLASPAHGERMAWDWLDAARYADSNGYQGDAERTMWPWRDWVVRAFEENLPFDEFTVRQLAGDLLPEAGFEERLATAFLRNHAINGEGGRIEEENRVEYVMDMTETTGTVWLGLTLNCCRCHDHKFDPLRQREYYGLSAYFNQTPVDGSGGDPQTPPRLSAPSGEQSAELARLAARLGELDRALAERAAELEAPSPGEERAPAPSLWRALRPSAVSALVQELAPQPDASILAGGPSADNDTYTVVATTDIERIAGIRLEALRHVSLTGGGLARSESGNFVLTGFELAVEGPDGPPAQRVSFARAEASFEQAGFPASGAIDSDPSSGWAVHEGRPVDHDQVALFRLDPPLEAGPGARLRFVLRHDSRHARHNLGRFRLAATDDAAAPLVEPAVELERHRAVPGERRDEAWHARARELELACDATHTALAAERAALLEARRTLEAAVPQVMVMADRDERRPTYVLAKGIYSQRGDQVEAGTPACLPPLPEGAPANRLALARWIVSDENPLAGRVAVNRIWQQLFGVGLVKTSEDFGAQGDRPPQQELLDWLAVDLRASGWDVRALLRRIVTSDTYRRSSAAVACAGGSSYELDPENRLLARGPRFRLPSWMLRDQALAASGLLVRRAGGPPVLPLQPDGIWEEASFGTKTYRRGTGEDLYRRSLYTFWRRIVAPPAFFDNAGRQVSCVRPLRTNSPLHALYTLNDPTFVECARALAERALLAGAEARERLDRVFVRVLARNASEVEAALFLELVEESRAAYAADPAAARELLAVGESPRDESLDPAEHAAWTGLALAVLNLDEALTKE